MYTIKYNEESLQELQEIFDYIAIDSRKRAIDYMEKMSKCIEQLSVFPNIGSKGKYHEFQEYGIRMLPFENYLIFYIIKEQKQEIGIIHVLHGSREYIELFKQ
jgi:toxin ParE1/3/4